MIYFIIAIILILLIPCDKTCEEPFTQEQWDKWEKEDNEWINKLCKNEKT